MRSLVAIGDIHGLTRWRQIINDNPESSFIFIGDFFDNYFKTTYREQIENFNDILAFKRANKDKVTILIGNHDYQYIYEDTCSGYQPNGAEKIGEAINAALREDLLQMCHVHQNILFSHAGVSKTWCYNNHIVVDSNIDKSINSRFQYAPLSFKFRMGDRHDLYGNETCQTPIWIRPEALRKDAVNGFIQVVGHTAQKSLFILDDVRERDVILIDCLGESQQYLVITDDEFIVRSVANDKVKTHHRK